jgi:type VI secretion system protein ImpL
VVPQVIQWPGAAAGGGRSAVSLSIDPSAGIGTPPLGSSSSSQPAQTAPVVLERTGAWSLFRLLDNAHASKSGDRLVVTFVLGGRDLQYSFTVGSVSNPFTLPALREFHCPTGM